MNITENKQKILWITGSAVFALAGAGALLTGVLAAGFDCVQNWEHMAGDGPVHIDLSAVFTVSLVFCLALGVLALGGLGVSLVFCGPPHSPVHMTWFDRIFTEIQLLVGLLAGCGLMPAGLMIMNWFQFSPWTANLIRGASGIAGAGKVEEGLANSTLTYMEEALLEPNEVTLILGMLIAVCMLAVIALVLQAVVKKIKNHCFWRGTLIGWLVLQGIALAERSTSLTRKVFIVVIAAVLLSMSWVGAILVIVCACVFLPKYLKQFQQIREGAARIRRGELTYRIPVMGVDGVTEACGEHYGREGGSGSPAMETEEAAGGSRKKEARLARGRKDNNVPVAEGGELARLAEDINAISSAQYAAIQQELKTQRMQTDLITNVSHDLKTPLTSMVSYVDLLKSEGLEGEHAPEYLQILDEKTQRLQKLSEDLFEAAKASSGDIPVHLECIDAAAAVNQALGETEEVLAARQVEVIVSQRAEDARVLADGRHLWRVIENLLGNIGKYAMPGSRAYIDIEDDAILSQTGQSCLQIAVKNMSAEPLNIPAEELMERFRRGDDARTTEGSGLGLAIARDLVRVMDGRFELTIDGDLFKVTFQLPKAAERDA